MKIGMLFPGYGSQFVGMAKELYDESRIVQEYFEEASSCLDKNFVKLCFASSDTELGMISNAYTATFLVSSSIYALLKAEDIKPDVIAGYNLGEYAAMFAAGGLNFPDGLYLLNKIAQSYAELLKELKAVVIQVLDVPTAQLEDICLQVSTDVSHASIAIYNSWNDHIVAGHKTAVDQVQERLEQEFPDSTAECLETGIGLHSMLMNPIVEKVSVYLEKVDFHDVEIPIIESVRAQVMSAEKDLELQAITQLNHPLVWNRVLDALHDYDILVEIGPGTTLQNLVNKQYPEKRIISINKRSDIENLKKILMPNNEI